MKSLLLLSLFALFTIAVSEGGNALGGGEIVNLTSDNFDLVQGDWFLKFYAPWCGHCKRLTPVITQLSVVLAASSSTPTKIGLIDGSTERTLASRFNIKGFPTLFYVAPDGVSVYKYTGNRDVSGMTEFITGGYKSETALPFLASPFGPMGKVKGMLMYVGGKCEIAFKWFRQVTGLSMVAAAGVLALVVGFGGIGVILLLAYLILPEDAKDKKRKGEKKGEKED